MPIRGDLDYKASLNALPRCDWYHVKFMCRVFAAEALGLGMILFIVALHSAGGVLKSDVSGAFAAAGAFAVSVWIVGPVSGPQITPILSVALLMTRRMNFVYCILGMLGQLCGGLVGIALASRLAPGLDKVSLVLHWPGEGVTDGQAFGAECVCSFILIICCLSTLDEFRNPHWAQAHITIFSLIVFLLIMMLAAVLGKITGVGMNPAASLAGAIYSGKYDKVWIFIVAPVVGSIFAVLLWEMLLSDGASIERTKHWWTDPHFDRTKDYKRLKLEEEEQYGEEAMLRIGPH